MMRLTTKKYLPSLPTRWTTRTSSFPVRPPRLSQRKIGAVGEVFLPRSRRKLAMTQNPLGSGAPVWVASGSTAEEKLPLVHSLLGRLGSG